MDLNELESRLENWARALCSGNEDFAGAGAVSAECYYRAPGYRESTEGPPPVDLFDAAIVNAAWKRLMPLDRDLLTMHYVWRAPDRFILRRLKLIRARPVLMDAHVRRWLARCRWRSRYAFQPAQSEPDAAQAWNFALRHAQLAIAGQLLHDKREFAGRKKPDYTARRLLNPAIAE